MRFSGYSVRPFWGDIRTQESPPGSQRFERLYKKWRRKRDSNPRTSFPVNGFQDRRLKPLGHSSAHYLIGNRAPPRGSLLRVFDGNVLARATGEHLCGIEETGRSQVECDGL